MKMGLSPVVLLVAYFGYGGDVRVWCDLMEERKSFERGVFGLFILLNILHLLRPKKITRILSSC